MTDTPIDILKVTLEWAKAEIISSSFFAIFGIGFLVASYCLWQMGKTDTAKAYIIPLLVTGSLLIVIGVGLVISNQMRLSNFPIAYSTDAAEFLALEIARADKTISGYGTAIFKVLPGIVLVSAVIMMIKTTPFWQASCVSVIAMMAVILLIDTNAVARMENYKMVLLQAEQQQ